jgi:hypothetical protein
MEYAGFVGGAYTLQSVSADNQRCVNLYPQPDETGQGKSRAILLSTPGLVRLADVTATAAGGVRGSYTASNDRFFMVVGAYLFEFDKNLAQIGSYPLPGETGTGPVSMTDNGRDMMIATGPNGYWFHFSGVGSIGTIAVETPGSGWAVDDAFSIAGGTGATGTITAVSSTGAATGVAIAQQGTGYVDDAGAVATAVNPSNGVGLTVTVEILAGDTLTQITDDVFQGAVTCGFIDGYVVFNQPNSQQFWITNLYSTVINPLGFASAEGNPDNLFSLLVDHREIWLFGDTSTEVWYDSGNANFPFSFIQGAYISHGIVAPFSAVRLDNTTFWLGNDEFGSGIVWRANGYSPVRISNFALEQAIQRYPTITDAVAWTYQQDGHAFYVLNFPSGDATWVYDAATGMWHERAYLGTLEANDGALHRGRPICHSFAFGKHLVGDWETGYLYQLTPAVFDDDTREVKRLRRAPYINSENKRIKFSQFELAMEVGQGNPAAVDPVNPPAEPVDPQIILRWSDDGGFTWSNEHAVSMGVSGQYRQRVIWRRLGQSRQRIFEVSTGQNATNLTMFAAYLELEGGTS